MSPTVNKLLYELKRPAISFVFVDVTPFGAVKPYILHLLLLDLNFPSFDLSLQYPVYLKGIIFNPGCNIKNIQHSLHLL